MPRRSSEGGVFYDEPEDFIPPDEAVDDAPPRKRGRPKGSKNKVSKAPSESAKRRPGRPRKHPAPYAEAPTHARETSSWGSWGALLEIARSGLSAPEYRQHSLLMAAHACISEMLDRVQPSE